MLRRTGSSRGAAGCYLEFCALVLQSVCRLSGHIDAVEQKRSTHHKIYNRGLVVTTMLMMSRQSLVVTSLLLSPLTVAFLVPCSSRPRRCAFHVPPSTRRFSSSSNFVLRPSTSLCAKKDGEDDDTQDGMAEAFRELEALGPLGDDDFQPKSTIDDTRKGFQEVDVELPLKSDATPEAQVRLYKDMYTESEKGETELYSDLLSDMGGTPPAPKPVEPFEEEPVELIESLKRTPEDLDMFMNNALAEALAEARSKTPGELALDAENALNDKEMMKEIEQVFEKANKELLASIEEIRTEQVRHLQTLL